MIKEKKRNLTYKVNSWHTMPLPDHTSTNSNSENHEAKWLCYLVKKKKRKEKPSKQVNFSKSDTWWRLGHKVLIAASYPPWRWLLHRLSLSITSHKSLNITSGKAMGRGRKDGDLKILLNKNSKIVLNGGNMMVTCS